MQSVYSATLAYCAWVVLCKIEPVNKVPIPVKILHSLPTNLSIQFFSFSQSLFMYLTTLLHAPDEAQSIFKQFNWFEFRFSWLAALSKLKSLVYPTILTIGEERPVKFIAFPRVLTWYEMQIASSRIWTLVTTFISYDNISCTTSASQ